MEYHVPVLLQKSISGLQIKPEGTYLDLTFGGGGHSKEILNHLTGGKLIAFDQDSDASVNSLNDKRFILINGNFRFFYNYLRYIDVQQVDGILADLGVSSHHFNEAERGFSYRFDSNLDMRMNMEAEKSAFQVVNTYPESELKIIFQKYGEIPNSGKLASVIAKARAANEIITTNDFISAINSCVPARNDFKYLAKVFQALRIEVNDELQSLDEMLTQCTKAMKPGARLVVITYHSLEDRLVKNFMKNGMTEGQPEKDIYGNMDVPFKLINKKAIEPDEIEISENNRARSAKLRIAEKL